MQITPARACSTVQALCGPSQPDLSGYFAVIDAGIERRTSSEENFVPSTRVDLPDLVVHLVIDGVIVIVEADRALHARGSVRYGRLGGTVRVHELDGPAGNIEVREERNPVAGTPRAGVLAKGSR